MASSLCGVHTHNISRRAHSGSWSLRQPMRIRGLFAPAPPPPPPPPPGGLMCCPASGVGERLRSEHLSAGSCCCNLRVFLPVAAWAGAGVNNISKTQPACLFHYMMMKVARARRQWGPGVAVAGAGPCCASGIGIAATKSRRSLPSLPQARCRDQVNVRGR